MPLTGHSFVQDRSEGLRARFDKRRRLQLAAKLTPEVEAEFRADVEGRRPRSLLLRHLLNFIRMTPIEGRPFAYATPPYQTYFVGRLHAARGEAPSIDESCSYASREDAIFAVFEQRLADLKAAAKAEESSH